MTEIAILGFGVVGSGTAEVISMNRDHILARSGVNLNVKKILDVREIDEEEYKHLLTRNPDEIFNDPDIKIIVETIGGTGIAYEYTKRAFASGKSVVTSNKDLLAVHGPELLRLAEKNKVSYLFEASVGGGIPIIRPLYKCMVANEIQAIRGILNGTTNYILTKMSEDEISFEEALANAQELGYAEQNPVSDIEGFDSARKLAIMTGIATGEYIDYRLIYTEGISKISGDDVLYADELGYKIKLIASMQNKAPGILEAIVAPMLVPDTCPLTTANNAFNAILLEGNALGPAMFYGSGAGKLPTASAVVADVVEAALHVDRVPHDNTWSEEENFKLRDHGETRSGVFVRLKDNEQADALVDRLSEVTDVSYAGRKFASEKAYLVGMKNPLTEKEIRNMLGNFSQTISSIRIYNQNA